MHSTTYKYRPAQTYLKRLFLTLKCTGLLVPYMAKLLSGKTFMVSMQMTIHSKTFALA